MTAEEFIKDYTYGCSNELVGWSDGKEVVAYHEWLTPSQALRAVELKKEEVIEKACEWIDFFLRDLYIFNSNDMQGVIEDFKKAMQL